MSDLLLDSAPAADAAAVTAVIPPTSDPAPAAALLVGLGVAASAVLAGCGSGGGGDAGGSTAPLPATTTITGLVIKDAGSAPVTVSGIVGSPGVAIALDDGGGPASRPRDPGPAGGDRSYSFTVSGSGGGVALGLTINPLPATFSTLYHAQLVAARRAVAGMGFAPSWDELLSHLPLTHVQRVDRMLGRMRATPFEDYPAWIGEACLSDAQYLAMTQPQRDAYNAQKGTRRTELKAWWYRQLVTNPDHLTERLTLFWHNLFTTSLNDVDQPIMVVRQHRLYRERLGGTLPEFLKAMARDAAMVAYLDSALNRKGRPNENFARELMELFTLGELSVYHGYAEADIPIVARCFTGYGLSDAKEFLFNPSDHDFTAKTLWGHTFSEGENGALASNVVIDLILEREDGSGHSIAARYLTTRLWREFIGDPQPGDDTTILAIADAFRTGGWQLTALYRAIFTAAAFTDPARRGTRFRSPAELFVGFFRALDLKPARWDESLNTLANLEQGLLEPPSVFGWKFGRDWISVKTLADRHLAAFYLGYNYRGQVPARLQYVLDILLLAIDPLVPPTATDAGNRALQYVQDPTYNLH